MPFTVEILAPVASTIFRAVVNEIAPVPLAVRSAFPLARLIVPVVVPSALTVRFLLADIVTALLKVTPAPVVSVRLFACVSAALTVIAPVFASPKFSVPAVMRSSSASVSPSVPVASAPPRSMRVPLVRWRMLAAFVPAFTVAGVPEVSRLMLSALIVSVPLPPTPMVAPDCAMRSLAPAPALALPVMLTFPPPDVIVLPAALVRKTPCDAAPPPVPVPRIVSVPVLPAVSVPPFALIPAPPPAPPVPVTLTFPPDDVICPPVST